MEPREHSGLSPALDETIASSLERFVSTSRSMDLLDDTMDSPSRRTPDLDGPLPAQIGRFEVRSRLGAGGMGVVYAAHDPTLDRPVALKIIRVEVGGPQDSTGTNRLIREAQALAKLSHPNVVSVYEVGRVDDQICLVMELVRGLDLGRWLGRETRSWDQVLAVYCDAGRGLAAAHAAGLIHRDFKPSNAIVGDDGRIRVLDFGLARARARPSDKAERDEAPPRISPSASATLDLRLTRTGALLGTPAYMAPEQFLDRTVDAASDQFAFCVALYSALFGEAPFPGSTVLALCEAVCAGRVRTPRPGPVPAHVVQAILRGLAVDPAARWPSMDLLLAELTHRPEPRQGPSSALFGHRGPQGRLRQRLADLRRGRGGVVILEGEAGLGKSRLARTLADEARELGVRVLRGASDSQGFVAAYHAWRDVVVDVLDLADLAERGEPEPRRAHVDALFDQLGLRRELAPLLDDVVALGLADNEFTRQLDPTVRADNLLTLLATLLQRRLEGRATLILIEDAHWFDTASWALALALAGLAADHAILLLLTTRPDASPPPARHELLARPELESIQLSALSPEDSAALLGARLGLAELPDELARRAFEWTHGTPFFIEQVALALLEAGLVRQQGPRAVLVAGEAELAAFQVPGSVEALILRRLDRLAPAAREALNLAAALGRAVAPDELEALLHRVDPALDGPRALEALLAAGLLVRPPHDPGGLTFPHALAQKAIYEQTQPSVRRRFHEIIATWYEEHERAHAPDRLGVLAHHWTHAALPDKAVVYLAQAGEQAFLAFASREAITYLNEALAANDRLARPLTAATRARWHQMLGEAHVKLGEYHAARRHLAQSLRHLGYRPPGATLGVVLGVLGHLLRQLFNRLAPTAMVRSSGAAAQVARDAARIYQALSELAFFEQSPLHLTHAALAGLNIAERSGFARELAVNYSTVAILFGVLDRHRIARSYVERARAAAELDGTSATLAYTSLLRTVYGQSVPERAWLEHDLPAAIARFAALGDRPRVHISLANEAFYRLVIEDFVGAARTAATLLEHLESASPQIQNFALVQRLALDLVRGAPELAHLDRLEGLLQRRRLAHGDALLGEGVAAACRLRRGELSHALALAERVIARLAYQPPTTLYTSFGIRGALDVLLAIDPHGARKPIERARKALRQIAFHNPAVRPMAALADAQVAAVFAAPAAATRLAEHAAALASAARLHHSEGLAQLVHARLLAPADPERPRLLDAAERSLTLIEPCHALSQLRRALPPAAQ